VPAVSPSRSQRLPGPGTSWRRLPLTVLVFGLWGLAGLPSCGPTVAPNEPPEADPGCGEESYFFCRCEDGEPGTKRCLADGSGFEPCSCTSTSCVPGEATACGCEDGSTALASCGEDGVRGTCPCAQIGAGDDDDCPGKAVAVARSSGVKIAGNTAKSTNRRVSSCGGEGAEQVFQLVPGADGDLQLDVRAIAPLDAILTVYSAPCGESERACVNDQPAGGTEWVTVPVTAGAPVFAVIDSAGPGGSFVLTATLETKGSLVDVCPGVPVSLGLGQALTLSGSTLGLGDDRRGPAATLCSAGQGAPDAIYAVTSSQKGLLTATLRPSPGKSGLLYATATCVVGTNAGGSKGCVEAAKGVAATLLVQVGAGQTLSLVVDGEEKNGFDYDLDVALDPD
jgi:hypothetical protein